MNHAGCRQGSLAPTLAALTVLALTAPSHASAPAPKHATANYEVRFLEGMIDHHQMAVHMGEVCLEKAVHEDLRVLCGDIVSAQTMEIEEMQAWLSEWYGIEHAPRMKPNDVRRMTELASLSGADFEVAFLEEMIAHHRGAVREGRRCIDRAAHSELIELCESIVETQLSEIERMSGWLCDWYGRCDGA